MVVIVRRLEEPYSRTGFAWRAFLADGTPLYLGSETLEALKRRVLDLHPGATFEERD
jgi:hypothetical protein